MELLSQREHHRILDEALSDCEPLPHWSLSRQLLLGEGVREEASSELKWGLKAEVVPQNVLQTLFKLHPRVQEVSIASKK